MSIAFSDHLTRVLLCQHHHPHVVMFTHLSPQLSGPSSRSCLPARSRTLQGHDAPAWHLAPASAPASAPSGASSLLTNTIMSQADTDYSRSVWRLDANSIIYHLLVNVRAQHILIDEHNASVEHIPAYVERDDQRIPIGPLAVRCWILICMFSHTLMWTIGLPDNRVFGGRRPLDVAAPLPILQPST